MITSAYKKIRKSSWIQVFAAFLATQYLKFVWLTSRWEYIDRENIEPYWNNNTAIIGCFWHGRLSMMLKAWESSQKFYMLISNNIDGKIGQRLVENFGYGVIAGSSSKGGKAAVLAMVKTLKQGQSIGITPDGPRGPRHRSKLSVIQMARMGETVIIPFTWSSTRGKFMNTWDRFFFPLPFGRGVYICGTPIEVIGSSKSDEELRQELENALIEITQRADHYCGHGVEVIHESVT